MAERKIVKLTATSAGLTIAVTAYTSGDQLGTLLTFSPALSNGTKFRVVNAKFLDAGDVLAATELWLFNSAVTLAADNAAFSVSDADMLTCQGVISWATADVIDAGPNKFAHTLTERSFWGEASSAGVITGALVTRSGNAVFTAVTDITVTLWLEIEN